MAGESSRTQSIGGLAHVQLSDYSVGGIDAAGQLVGGTSGPAYVQSQGTGRTAGNAVAAALGQRLASIYALNQTNPGSTSGVGDSVATPASTEQRRPDGQNISFDR